MRTSSIICGPYKYSSNSILTFCEERGDFAGVVVVEEEVPVQFEPAQRELVLEPLADELRGSSTQQIPRQVETVESFERQQCAYSG